jgi:hypothetical protein
MSGGSVRVCRCRGQLRNSFLYSSFSTTHSVEIQAGNKDVNEEDWGSKKLIINAQVGSIFLPIPLHLMSDTRTAFTANSAMSKCPRKISHGLSLKEEGDPSTVCLRFLLFFFSISLLGIQASHSYKQLELLLYYEQEKQMYSCASSTSPAMSGR